MSTRPPALAVLQQRTYPPGVPPRPFTTGQATIVSASTLEFESFGSFSCPPRAKAVTIDAHRLGILVGPAAATCTLDLRPYTLVLTLNQPVLRRGLITGVDALSDHGGTQHLGLAF